MTKKPEDPANSRYNADFRARLRAVREELNFNQAQMAEHLGITEASLQKFETRSMLPLHRIQRLAALAHRDIETIITGRGFGRLHVVKRRAGN